MFYDSAKASDGNSIVDYKGEVSFSDAELKKILEGVLKARDFYARRGIKYLLVIAPNKENIYAEYMPENLQKVRKSDKSRADIAAEYIAKNSDVPILNLKQALLEAKKSLPMPLYYKRDTHWNAVGGYVGFSEMVKELKKAGLHVPYQKLSAGMIKNLEKIHTDMDMTAWEMSYTVDYLPKIVPEQVLKGDDDKQLYVFETKNSYTGYSLLMVRDSFAKQLIPFLAKLFKESVFIHRSDKFHEEAGKYLDKYKVDVFIDEVVERRVDKFLNYSKHYGRQ
jgi:hypothetical protein